MRALGIIVVIALVGGCGRDRGPRWRDTGATEPRDGGTLRIAAKDGLSTLDPALAYDEVSLYALHPMVDGLVGYDPRGTALVPRLAERWEIAPDGLTYRFHLRPELRYGDGLPIVAADFERALLRVLGKSDSPFRSHLVAIAGAEEVIDGKATRCAGIVVIDDRTLELRLVRPNAALLYELAMPYAAPLHAGHLAEGDDLRRRPLASGPYELVAWDEGRRIELVRRAHYHDPSRQRIERMILLERVPRELQFMMFERGELDAAERMSAPDRLWLEQQPAWAPYVHKRALLNAFGSRMNTRVAPFDDRRVRQALNHAIDKRHVAKLLGGTAEPAHGVLAPGAFGRDDTLEPYPYDPDRARRLLAEAGYPDGFDVEYVTFPDEDADKLAVLLQSSLAKIGVRMKISQVTFSVWATIALRADGPPFSIATWVGDSPDPTSLLDPLFHSRNIADEGSTNYAFYESPELDALLDAARGEPDVARRAELYRRAERILYEDAPWIWGYHQRMTEVTQPYVRDYAPHPVWIRDYTMAWLDLGPDGEPLPR
jgi:ABC-type transport system substrate-binding protein